MKRRSRCYGMRRQHGVTFIEIAIVLVAIGLLLGGVLKGQELVMSARVRQLIAQQDNIKAAFFGFQDRFRAFPGDYAAADSALRCPGPAACLNGNGNGIVESNASPAMAGSGPSETREDLLVWMHLASAGLLAGGYAMTAGESAASDGNSPRNPYGIFQQIAWDAQFAAAGPVQAAKHNLKSGAQIPVEVIAEIDRKVDDGNGVRGEFRYSTYQGNAPSAPSVPAASYAPEQCISAAGVWHVTRGEINCGGASLL